MAVDITTYQRKFSHLRLAKAERNGIYQNEKSG